LQIVPGTTYFSARESTTLLRMIGWSPFANASLNAIRGAKSATCTTSPAPLVICRPDYNIAPTDTIDVVKAADGGATELVPVRWGLIPYWWKKPVKQLPATFNARQPTPR
jgi:putative SOS response-associated peptidase YedK